MAIPFRDLEIRKDVKGGSPRTPPRGIPVSEFKKYEESRLREYVDVKFEALNDSILAAKIEMDRRMEHANNLRGEVMEDRTQYLKLEKFEGILSEWNGWRSRLDTRITVIETRSVTWTAALGVFFIIIQMGIYWFSRR